MVVRLSFDLFSEMQKAVYISIKGCYQMLAATILDLTSSGLFPRCVWKQLLNGSADISVSRKHTPGRAEPEVTLQSKTSAYQSPPVRPSILMRCCSQCEGLETSDRLRRWE